MQSDLSKQSDGDRGFTVVSVKKNDSQPTLFQSRDDSLKSRTSSCPPFAPIAKARNSGMQWNIHGFDEDVIRNQAGDGIEETLRPKGR